MYCTVYQLRQNGEKLPKEEVRTHPHAGWLFLGKDARKFYPQTAARLFRSQHDQFDVIEILLFPQVDCIQRGGLLITGQEERPRVQDINPRQAWWVVPLGAEDRGAGVGDPGAPE